MLMRLAAKSMVKYTPIATSGLVPIILYNIKVSVYIMMDAEAPLSNPKAIRDLKLFFLLNMDGLGKVIFFVRLKAKNTMINPGKQSREQ